MNFNEYYYHFDKANEHLKNAKKLESNDDFFGAKDEYFYACQHFLFASKIAGGLSDNTKQVTAEQMSIKCKSSYNEMIYKQWEKNKDNIRPEFCK